MREIFYDCSTNKHDIKVGNLYFLKDVFFPKESNWLNEEYNNKIGLFLRFKDNKQNKIYNEYIFYIDKKFVCVDAWSLNIFELNY